MTRIVTVCFLFAFSSPAVAQDAPPPNGQQEAPPKGQGAGPDSTDAEAPPTLDDLLGLEKDPEAERAREVAERNAEEELERALVQQQIDDAFKAALAQMAVSVELLGDKFDSGLGTQRVQEEVLRKLDELIESARKQQSNSSSSSSSSSQQQQQQQQPRPQQQNQGDPNNQSTGNQPAQTSPPRPPDGEQGTIGSILAEERIEWGSLPPRFRDQLLQSIKEDPSALYRRLTEEYYRKLAEESSG